MAEDGPSRTDWVVLKFGGTSVATIERWQTIARVLAERHAAGERVMLVCSALSGVSNLLEQLLDALADEDETDSVLTKIRQRHGELATAMELDVEAHVGGELAELARLVEGARLIGGVPDEVRARVMAIGELMSTRLGAAWLQRSGLTVRWRDARELLRAKIAPMLATPGGRYLSATCHYDPDTELIDELDRAGDAAVLTQGFIASDDQGETVLLGRGGSDTSAAYLAGKLNAQRLEIWTDVPGLFTANPKNRPDARLLRLVTFEEAQVLAAMGARVLHPRCIPPVRDNDIPLHIRWTQAPDVVGTIVSSEAESLEPGIKGLASRHHIYMIRIRCPGHWHLAGALAEVTGTLARYGIAIDLIANSASRITLTIDPAVCPLGESERDQLMDELEQQGLARAEFRDHVGSISLVGSNITSVIHKLAPALEPMAARRIYLVSEAAPDDALSFVLEPEDVDRLLNPLHEWLLNTAREESVFGPSWDELSRQLP